MEADEKFYFLLWLLLSVSIIGFCFWWRNKCRGKTFEERQKEYFNRQLWWNGQSWSSRLCKGLLLFGNLCVVANIIFQGVDIRCRNNRAKKYHGQVCLYVVKKQYQSDNCQCRAELYNGLNDEICVGCFPTNQFDLNTLMKKSDNKQDVISLNEVPLDKQGILLSYDDALTINFSAPISLLPCNLVVNYLNSNGSLKNVVLYLSNR